MIDHDILDKQLTATPWISFVDTASWVDDPWTAWSTVKATAFRRETFIIRNKVEWSWSGG
jgi:hypothetical protein